VPVIEKLPESHFEDNLALFASLLREEGLPVGTTEMVDALNALSRIDLSSRGQFKASLQATMVKAHRDQALFNRLFDRFFLPPEEYKRQSEKGARYKKELERKIDEACREMQFKGEMLGLSQDELKQYSSLSTEQRSRLQDFVAKTEAGVNVEPQFRPLLENVVKSHLRYCRSQDKQRQAEMRNNGAGSGTGGEGAVSSDGSTDYLREIDIEQIQAAELPAAEQLLQRLSRKLAVQILRRRRSGPRSGPLDLRRSLRDNMRYGGIIFKLKHKPKRRSKQQLLLLCDVSGSMKNYSTFVIHFLLGLQEVVRNLSCFSFSDNIENLTPELKGRSGLKPLLDRVIRRSKNWGGGTNLAAALDQLTEKYPDYVNAKTTLIVVSDTKTVSIDQTVKKLEMIRDRVKRIIWLNPMPLEQWSDYRSVSTFGELVDMWPCSTISQLEEVLAGKL